MFPLNFRYFLLFTTLLNISATAPTFSPIDISLSFIIIVRFFNLPFISFNASNVVPFPNEASPIIAITSFSGYAIANPAATERAPPACPLMNWSWGLSLGSVKGPNPFFSRIVLNLSPLPVIILCG